MVQRATKFTPEVLLSAPRRSAGVPNPAGDTIIYTVSTYSFESHKKTTVLRALDVKAGNELDILAEKDVSSLNWVDDDHPIFLCSESNGTTTLCLAHVPWDRKSGQESQKKQDLHVAGTIDAPASDLRICKLDSEGNDFAVVFVAKASPDGSLYNPEKASEKRSTGRLYSNLFVRHWDAWKDPEKNSLFYSKLSKDKDGNFKLGKVHNALKDTGLESPVPTFGGTDNFDISRNRIIFVAKDPDLNVALNTKSDVYLLRISSWEEQASPVIERVVVRGFEGASTSPVFSTHGSRAAFLTMKQNGYEADRNDIFVLEDLDGKEQNAQQVVNISNQGGGKWDHSPGSICFASDGVSLFAIAEDKGYAKLFLLGTSTSGKNEIQALTGTGSVMDVAPLANGTAFISASNIVDSSFFAFVDPSMPAHRVQASGGLFSWTHSSSSQGNKFGLSYGQLSSIWTPASNPSINKEVHSIVVRPSNFESGKKYPVAYLIHGGPQGSWTDSWSTRWNPAVFAEQGYIVVAPNVTGSTGYGQKFTDSIQGNWGGDPYQDIVNVYEWVGKNLKEADNDRAVALGASFGGYMMNWIQGHDLGREFKALVCHDGIMSLASMLSTEELYFVFNDIGGTPWDNPKSSENRNATQTQLNFGGTNWEKWRRWDPSEHLSEWATPELIIHSTKDYRIALADGLAAFNVLQTRGVPSQLLTFPDENHWVLKPENSLAWHKTVLNFINKYVGLPPYTTEDPNSDDFWGGPKPKNEERAELMAQGKPET